ncbi:hypothetical protein FCR2A7T_13510 [Flavobacterium cauense R2A-7]|uniref:Lipocalin-like protein n=1 Tax=Flavobacterium cauense R2A-7 TaxID=1341154 RepID=V6S0L0_9FLAO|nr:hypothetical protein [Flavobacterium cauense]ESU19944.1 hypothetical protein FCR2A7T_13510 [Flavobacterium cauense R2A-7]TWI12367.1 hypothetical protein IP98_01579 [Flavobacterium cauense R2A-7]
MRNLFKTIFLLFTLIMLNGCSSNDESSNSNLSVEEQALLGTWKYVAYGHVNSNGTETVSAVNSQCLNTHIFTSDRNINYRSYSSCSEYYEEDGTWTLVNGLLTRTFPQTVTVIQKDNITFINPDKIKLFEVGNTTDFVIYEREGSTIVDTSYKIELTGNYQTDWCDATGNTSKVTFEFLQDGNVVATQNAQSNIEQALTVSRDLTGNVIGIKLKLTDYNPSNLNSGLGEGFDSLHLKVTGNQTQDVLIDTNPNAWLVNCADICYEINLLFNTSTEQLTVNSSWH